MKKIKFIEEFKEFISRGNVIDMAIGVVVGGAFKGIVDSLVKDIIMPFVGMLTGGIDFSNLAITLAEAVTDETGAVVKEAVTVNYGTFINTIISFIIIAFCLFVIVKIVNKLRRKKEEPAPAPAPEPEPSAEEKLLSEIRDLLKENANVK